MKLIGPQERQMFAKTICQEISWWHLAAVRDTRHDYNHDHIYERHFR